MGSAEGGAGVERTARNRCRVGTAYSPCPLADHRHSGRCTAAGLGDWLDTGPGQLRSLTAVLLLAALLAMVVAVDRAGWWSALPIGLGLIGIWVAGLDDPPLDAATEWWPSFVAAVLGSYLLVRFGAGRWVLTAGVAILVISKVTMVIALRSGPIEPVDLLDLIPQFAQNMAIVLVSAVAIRSIPAMAQVADAAELPVHQRRLLDSVALRQRRQLAAARRRVHDDVLPALRLAAAGEPDQRIRRQMATRAIDHLTSHAAGEGTAFVDVVPPLKAVDRAGVQVRWQGVDRLPAPSTVAEAMAGSLAELLRNVRQHAGVGVASVTVGPIRWSPGSVRVVVSDGGSGFDTRRSRPDGWVWRSRCPRGCTSSAVDAPSDPDRAGEAPCGSPGDCRPRGGPAAFWTSCRPRRPVLCCWSRRSCRR